MQTPSSPSSPAGRTLDVAVLTGSLRRGSLSAGIAQALAGVAPAGLAFSTVETGDLALYNPDLEEAPPAPWVAFRQRIAAADALLFVTAEWNRSIPSPLKNAVDVGSRPYGKAAWSGKSALVVSHSPGLLGGFGANHHLRQSLAGLNVAVLPAPEVYLSHSAKLVGEDGAFASAETRDFLTGAMASFADWIRRTAGR